MNVVAAARPLTDFVAAEDIPLGEFLPAGALTPLDGILVSEAWTSMDGDGFMLTAQFHFGQIDDLKLPGFDQLGLRIGDSTGAVGRMVVGPASSLALDRIGLTLTISADILSTPAGQPAEISSTGSVLFDADGFHFDGFDKVSLPWSRVAGSEIEVQLTDICHPTTPQDGVLFSIGSARVKLPMVRDTKGDPLMLEGLNLTFGSRGPSGDFRMAGAAIEATVAGFDIRVDDAEVNLRNGELDGASLKGALNIAPLRGPGAAAEWIAVELGVSAHGVTATLHAEDGESLPQLEVQDLFVLDLTTLRLDAPSGGAEPVLWMSGGLTPKIGSVEGDWPTFVFDELGLTAHGQFRLAKGASIATDEPFTVCWKFVTLTVTAFNLERPADAGPDALELRISAGIELLKGLPAGASVEGLVARWSPGAPVAVRFAGIGLSFGSPNAYAVDVKISYDDSDNSFTGTGKFDLQALDLSLDVVFDARTSTVGGKAVPTLFVSAESSLFPGGIPIGSTGLSLYGVNGLLAHNLELKVDNTAPADPRRYFDLFKGPPQVGFGRSKWRTAAGAEALGLGVLIGTADDGWAVSAHGALILQLPDLSILVTATADLLTSRPEMKDATPGRFSALLAVLPASNLMRLDFEGNWTLEPLYSANGAGGGEFHFDRPLDWSVWLGKKESPIAARMLKFDDWLINADYWLGINSTRSVNVGAKAAFDLRFGGGDLYAEVEGLISGDLMLAWSPFQMEGTATLQATARLAAGGLSLSFSLDSGLTVELERPKYFELPIRACVHFDFVLTSFDICLAHNFTWRDESAPEVNAELTDAISFVPRLWTPPAGATAPEIDGVVTHRNPGQPQIGVVQPHSEIVLEFPKPVAVDAPRAHLQLNDVADVRPDLVGEVSKWQIRYALKALELVDLTANTNFELFGTFSRSTADRVVNGQAISARPPNTSLRLLSSNRFGGPGSIDGGGVENTPPIDCTSKPTVVRRCVDLKDLQVGAGRLANGWLYQWTQGKAPLPRLFRDKGVRLLSGDTFTVFAPEGLANLSVSWIDVDGSTLPSPLPPERHADPGADALGTITLQTSVELFLRLCWDELITAADGGAISGWAGSSGHESWTVDADKGILHPGHDYAMKVELEAKGLDPQGNPTGAVRQFNRDYTFRAAGAPDWTGALNAAVAGVYPADGVRPAFLNYDLVIHFRDPFIRALYDLDDRALGVRLRDANGVLVAGPGGETVQIPTAWRKAPGVLAPAEDWWRKARAGDLTNPCEAQAPIEPGDTVLPVPLSALPLKPLARYTAELVAIGINAAAPKPLTEVLAQWSFTTSAFHTFTELATQNASSPATVLSLLQPAGDTFETMILAFGAAPIAVVSETGITPIRAGDTLAYLLIEAPEPLNDPSGRLSVTLAGTTTELLPNADQTRIIARLTTPQLLAGLGSHIAVTLTWQDKPANAAPETVRTVLGADHVEVCNWSVSLLGLR